MLLLIGPARDGRHKTYICRGSDRQIEPLGPNGIKSLLKIGEGGSLTREGGGVPEPLEPSPGYARGCGSLCCVVYLQIFLQIKLAKLKLKEAGSWGIIGDGERVLKTGEATLSNSFYFINSITE